MSAETAVLELKAREYHRVATVEEEISEGGDVWIDENFIGGYAACFVALLAIGKHGTSIIEPYLKIHAELTASVLDAQRYAMANEDYFVNLLTEFPADWLRWASKRHYARFHNTELAAIHAEIYTALEQYV